MTAFLDALQAPGGVIRHVTALLCILAFAGLMWRLLATLGATRTLVSAVTALLAVLELVVGLGAARRAALGGPVNEALYAILVHAVLVLALVIAWNRLPNPAERSDL